MALKVGILGGGAAGMMAAIWAARGGCAVSLLEKNDKLGKKILVSGNGRCNITDAHMSRANYHGEDADLAWPTLSAFNHLASRAFFAELGLETQIERFGRVFPVTNQAQSVVDVLEFEMRRLGVQIHLSQAAKHIQALAQGFEVRTRQEKTFRFDKLVVACGGCSYPQLGGSGEGYDWAQSLGLKVEKPFPAIVALELEGNWYQKLQGVKVDLRLTLNSAQNGQPIETRFGEMLFTSYGISGPVAMAISRETLREFLRLNPSWEAPSQTQPAASQRPQKFTPVTLLGNFFDQKNAQEVAEILRQRWQRQPDKPLSFSFVGLFNNKLAPVLLNDLGYDQAAQKIAVKDLGEKDLAKISHALSAWPFQVKGSRPFSDAQGSAGGVSMRELNPQTLEAKKLPGLYFIGEVLDIDGDCGGYNMQWAWSSGSACGKALAQLNGSSAGGV